MHEILTCTRIQIIDEMGAITMKVYSRLLRFPEVKLHYKMYTFLDGSYLLCSEYSLRTLSSADQVLLRMSPFPFTIFLFL